MFLIADYDKAVDDRMGWLFSQAWHFNTNSKDQLDSRIVAMTLMLIIACSYFDNALLAKNQGLPYNYYLNQGLEFLGYALHPAQDYFAHTDDRVYDILYQTADEYYTFSFNPPFIIYHPPTYVTIKSHVVPGDTTDNVLKRWDQLEKTARMTIGTLTDIYKVYKPIFQ